MNPRNTLLLLAFTVLASSALAQRITPGYTQLDTVSFMVPDGEPYFCGGSSVMSDRPNEYLTYTLYHIYVLKYFSGWTLDDVLYGKEYNYQVGCLNCTAFWQFSQYK